MWDACFNCVDMIMCWYDHLFTNTFVHTYLCMHIFTFMIVANTFEN